MAAALLLAAPGLFGQTAAASADAMALLARSAAAFSTGAADASAFTQIYTPAGFATARRESGTVWVQAPARLRFDYAAPDVKVFTYDDGEGRFLSPEDKQLTVHKLSADEKARLPIVFLEKPDELAKRYDISRDAAGVVVLKPRAGDSELAWLKIRIGDAGMVETLAYEDTSGNRTEFRFDGWKTEKARPAADYRVTGPKGTRIVEN
ncbi:MAG TPA: outer membrane lipoprotein carrier protein LolA [Thermoanaerobaculia bacterium]